MFYAPETPDPGDTPETRHHKWLRWLANRNHVQQMNAINAGLGGDPIRPGELKYVFFLLAKIISGIFMAGSIVLVLLHTLFGNAHGKQVEHHRIADWIGQKISADYQLSPASTYMSQAQLASLMPASELAVASTMENPAIKDHNGAGFNRINASAYACRTSPSCMASLDQESPMATQWAIGRSKAFLLQYLFYNKKKHNGVARHLPVSIERRPHACRSGAGGKKLRIFAKNGGQEIPRRSATDPRPPGRLDLDQRACATTVSRQSPTMINRPRTI